MDNNLFAVLISTLRARFTSAVTKLKYWTSAEFWRAQVYTKIREWLTNIFNVRPRHKKDYYSVFGWLVSRRLAHAVVIVTGMLCLVYLLYINPVYRLADGIGSGEKIYSYNSLPLRFMEGDVKIEARSGYVAYEGAVSKGYASGEGTLYDSNNVVVYRGAFDKNMYNGEGILFYPSGQAKYQGEFSDNLFEGTGKLFRENGTMIYSGEFSAGLKEGTGTLYNSAETAVFTGSFHSDELVYSQLLGKTSEDISDIYTGDKILYIGDDEAVQVMTDIDAFYVANTGEASISDSVTAEQLYVCKDTFIYGDNQCTTIDEVAEVLGNPVFEGTSYVMFAEAVGIDWMQKQGYDIQIDVALSAEHPLKESYTVNSFDGDALLYLYVFQKDETSYMFFSEDNDKTFFMYEMSV